MIAGHWAEGLTRPGTARLDDVVVLDANDPELVVTFVAWLRDQVSETTDVVWRGVVNPGIETTLLHHLPPPAPGDEVPGSAQLLSEWRTEHRPALCYYRLGPGFVQVKDVRTAQRAARFVLDDEVLVDTFTGCLRPRRIGDLTGPQGDAARALIEERLLLRIGDWVTTLPSRMRRWPVPSQIA
jgi:hypothetical protein